METSCAVTGVNHEWTRMNTNGIARAQFKSREFAVFSCRIGSCAASNPFSQTTIQNGDYSCSYVFIRGSNPETTNHGKTSKQEILWCRCGGWSLWSWDIWSKHNSQHLIDPYTLTHVLHGVLLCGLLCVRRTFLCGKDRRSKKDYSHLS